jgi:hypothetical protein
LAPPENSPTPRKKPGLVARWGLPAAVGVALIAGCIYFDLTMNPHSVFKRIFQRSEPVYQWVQSEDKTFSFLPGESKAWGPVEPQQGEVHYVINSYLPVDTGLIEEAQWGENTDAALKKTSACYESKIVHSAKICQVTSEKPQLIFIRDVRAKQVPLGGLGTISRKALQDQNSVSVTVFTRKCMEHCK